MTSIVLLHAGTVLDTRHASANSPTVQVTQPNGGEAITATTATTRIAWTANDADGDALTYTVEYSRDGGASWSALALRWVATQLDVAVGDLPGSAQALIRVTANDGFHATRDQSDAVFTVAGKPPDAVILNPNPFDDSDKLFVGDQTILFEGYATDKEDGAIPDADLVWMSDRNGELDTGPMVTIHADDLAEGPHVYYAGGYRRRREYERGGDCAYLRYRRVRY